ncbi:neck protein [Vibrio phage 1.233.A._10N.261.51.E6]|nr:neck protein [Vibrio phage 1.233.A._10N.261.51.E6]AUR96885.1 neck protein [Vibrio phage 1.233.B._10N.261.51.E6]
MSFADELNKETDNVTKALHETVKVSAIGLFGDVIYRSPVGNTELWDTKYPPKDYVGGRFRSNWFLTFTSPSVKKTNSTERADATKEQIEAEMATAIATQRGAGNETKYILTNNLDYAEAIESGHSKQRREGVVAPAISTAERKLPKIEAAANKKFGVS